MRFLLPLVTLAVLYGRPAGMLLVYLRDRASFPAQRAGVYAAIAAEAS